MDNLGIKKPLTFLKIGVKEKGQGFLYNFFKYGPPPLSSKVTNKKIEVHYAIDQANGEKAQIRLKRREICGLFLKSSVQRS